MATNKRKEAAALFELIDKSTLKVPKAGGSLKIPGWWSNKTNPSNKEVAAQDATALDAAAQLLFQARRRTELLLSQVSLLMPQQHAHTHAQAHAQAHKT